MLLPRPTFPGVVIERFFARYEEVEHGKHVTTSGWASRAEADAVIAAAQRRAADHPH